MQKKILLQTENRRTKTRSVQLSEQDVEEILKTWAVGNLGFDKKAKIEFEVSQGVLCGVSMTDNEVEVGESEEEVVIFT